MKRVFINGSITEVENIALAMTHYKALGYEIIAPIEIYPNYKELLGDKDAEWVDLQNIGKCDEIICLPSHKNDLAARIRLDLAEMCNVSIVMEEYEKFNARKVPVAEVIKPLVSAYC